MRDGEAMAAADELNRPLAGGRKRRGKAGGGVVARLPWARMLGGALFLLVGGVALYVSLVDDPLGGEPHAVTPITEAESDRHRAESAPSGGARIVDTPRNGQGPERAPQTQNGVTVLRPDGAGGSQSVIISIPPEARDLRSPSSPETASSRDPARGLAPAPDSRLVEESRFGMLPRIGDDGAQPSRVYARPPPPDAATHPARVAILVTGLGISQSVTGDAIVRLPPDVTLAFAPYGGDLDRLVARARNAGHEVMLQVPMQPFDYPDNDPGPHTLTVDAGANENIERLHWVMGRFAGYTGIVNFMGGRFTADADALAPIIEEIAQRGLAIVDDGSSSRARIVPLAQEADIPSKRAGFVLDAVPRADAIDARLEALEEHAREHGFAFATASALPVSVATIERWAQDAAERGILLVPVSSGFPQGFDG